MGRTLESIEDREWRFWGLGVGGVVVVVVAG